MPLPLLATLATMATLEGGKLLLQRRAQDRNARTVAREQAMRAIQQGMGGGMPGIGAQGAGPMGQTALDATTLDEMMRRKLMEQVFAKLLPVTGGT